MCVHSISFAITKGPLQAHEDFVNCGNIYICISCKVSSRIIDPRDKIFSYTV